MTTCPACGHESAISWRCERCGRDLADVDDDDDGSAAPPLVADGSGGSRERGRGENTMERVSFRVPEQLLERFENAARRRHPTRSEALREAMRAFVDERADDSGPDNPYTGSDQRSFLRTDGGKRVSHGGGRAVYPRAERGGAAEVSREARDAARERQARREVDSQRRGGVGDQEPGDGRCPDCRGDVLPCLDCWLNGGGRDGE